MRIASKLLVLTDWSVLDPQAIHSCSSFVVAKTVASGHCSSKKGKLRFSDVCNPVLTREHSEEKIILQTHFLLPIIC